MNNQVYQNKVLYAVVASVMLALLLASTRLEEGA